MTRRATAHASVLAVALVAALAFPTTARADVPIESDPLLDPPVTVAEASSGPSAPTPPPPPTAPRRPRASNVGGGVLFVLGLALTAVSIVGVVVFAQNGSAHDSCAEPAAKGCGADRTLAPVFAVLAGISAGGGIAITATGASMLMTSGPHAADRPALAREPPWGASRAASLGKPSLVVPLSFAF